MEQHAVPQDITGFKFKLVGDMTLVQFGELAGGMVLAYVCYSIPTYAIIKFPLAFFFAMLGIGLAFVPIEERPMHVWIFNFFKAIYRPTYYIWKKNNVDFLQSSPTVTSPQANTSILKATPVLGSKISGTTAPETTSVSSPPNLPAAQPTPNPPPAVPSIDEFMKKREQIKETAPNPQPTPPPMTIEELVKRREELNVTRGQKEAISLSEAEKKVNDLTEQNKDLLRQIDEIKNQLYAPAGQDVDELNKNLDVLMEKKNKLAGEIATVRDELNGARVAPLANPAYQQSVPVVRKVTKVITPPAQRQTLVSLTSIPNVVNGQIVDETGKPLDGAIVIIKDENGNSIRALRTNKVGQFIASTPLSNGQYYIEVEKMNHTFDALQLALTGEILEPMEIKAKAT